MSTYELLAVLGIRVVEVPDLRDIVCFVPTQRVALLRAGIDDAEREAVGDWLLTEAMAATA